MNLGVIVLFAPRNHVCEITEKVVNLFQKIVNDLDSKMEYTLYSVITLMIDAYFTDEKKYQELMKMMNKNTTKEIKPQFESQKYLLEELEYRKEDLTIANEKIKEKDKALNSAKRKIAKLQSEIQILK